MSDLNVMRLEESSEVWGGAWTEKKLDAFSKYVDAYLAILHRHPYWQTIYFDGFAGSGSRKDRKSPQYEQLLITLEEERVYKGAAERVLRLHNSFDYYYFIDKQKSLDKLQAKLSGLPEAKDKTLVFRENDCNKELRRLAHAMQSDDFAALVLLDPFGMDVEWDSIASLKETRTDIWILLPTGVIVNRLLDRAYKLSHIERLEQFFGLPEEEIKAEFYKESAQINLFGEESKLVSKVENSIHHVAELYIRQLKSVWNYVTEIPLVLRNSRNVPIYHFVFASNNQTARKIAEEIIRSI
jgi:three-Cys-motif partner protein